MQPIPDIDDDEFYISERDWNKVINNIIGKVKIVHRRSGIEYLKEVRDVQEMSSSSAFSSTKLT